MENKDFKVIETQEQLDGIIQDRLNRAEKQYAKQYDCWTSPEDLNALKEAHKKELADLTTKHSEELAKYSEVETQLKEKDDKIHQYEISSVKNSVARDLNLPYEAVEFLQGEDEKSIRESAERLSKLSGSKHYQQVAPTKDNEKGQEDSYKSALRETLSQLTNN